MSICSKSLLMVVCLSAMQFLPVKAAAQAGFDPEAEIKELAPKALAIVKQWQTGNTKPVTRTLHIVYWTPADREPAPRYEERLSAIMLDIQAFYAKEMQRLGFGPLTISLDTEGKDKVRIFLVKGKQPYAYYKPQSGREIREECLPTLKAAGLDTDKETIVIFTNMSNWDAAQRRITQNSPYYASGSPVSGTAWQVDSPILELAALANKGDFVQDGQYGRISLGKYNSIFIGGVAHEIGHALGLPHNTQRASEQKLWGTTLMGSGNRTYGNERRGEDKGSYLNLAGGLRLITHPIFNHLAPLKAGASSFKFDELDFVTGDKSFTCSGKVSADVPVYAVFGYMDPLGGGDYDSLPAIAVPDRDGRFKLTADSLPPGKKCVFRLIALGADGTATSFASASSANNYPCQVTADGQPDLLGAQLRLDLAPAVQAFQKKDAAALKAIFQQLAPKYEKQRVFQEMETALANALQGSSATADALTATEKELALSQVRPQQASVGWLRPTYDHLPGTDVLLGSEGDLYARGLFAHAPARHAYQLGGKWQTLKGKAGLAQGNDGSVVFVIEGDGRELWRSPLVKPGNLQSYEVSVKDVQQLQLRVEDGGDGAGSDWGLWLEPVLGRP
jgi:hypothetical protein